VFLLLNESLADLLHTFLFNLFQIISFSQNAKQLVLKTIDELHSILLFFLMKNQGGYNKFFLPQKK